jgi:hypothetical protein
VFRDRAAVAALILVALILGAGVLHLLRLRYARGDVYPPYSSLRTDPLGARILHDALAESGAVAVERNFGAWSRLEGGAGTTVLILGLRPGEEAAGPMLEFAQRLAARGSRVVLTLAAETTVPERREREASKTDDVPGRSDPEPVEAAPDEEPAPVRRWGFALDRVAPEPEEADGVMAVAVTRGEGLPPSMPWRSVVVFDDVRDPWQVRYTVSGRPVMLERDLGPGSLVVLTDSYLLSNEAMRRDRSAALLAWLVGPARRVVFEETVHGIEESDTVAMLLRRYGLAAPAAALLVFAALALWHASAPMPPRRERPADPAVVPGRDSAAGLVTLLRRAVRPPDLLRFCVDEWSRSGGAGRAVDLQRIRDLPLNPRDPLGDYRRIHRIVTPMEGDHDR